MIHLLKKFKSEPDFGVWPQSDLSITTDSRSADQSHFFWCLVGQKFDAFQFAESVIQKGCPLIVYQKNEKNDLLAIEFHEKYKTCFLGLSDTTVGLQQLSHLYRLELKDSGVKVIGVAGSNGKTTTKELLRSILTELKLKVAATEKNNNNHIGVPLTILSANKNDDFLVLEFGSNHPGEMEVLCRISEVDAGVITNIGDTHLEFFHNRQNVLQEEGEIFYRMKRQNLGFVVLPKEDELLSGLVDNQIAFSIEDINWHQHSVDFKFEGKTYKIENSKLYGRHNFVNLALASSLLIKMKAQNEEKVLQAASKAQLPKNNRSEFLKEGHATIFLDAYNANPSSMRAALKLFADWCKDNKIPADKAMYILGDMYELGANEKEYHKDVAADLSKLGVKNVCFVGRFAKDYQSGFSNGKCYLNPNELKPQWNELINQYSAIFIKGSRGIQLETLLSEKRDH